ncbi:conserved hypothetical protein [Neospora caninum Liverpool]|uniref:Transmembrane protein n=1 Tax=Neospora caninum (strain Liverpool) TaxID=572307 RepID=F0VKN7_NEOCL|nr:conserved hypothetical protein [Neospora caninum Liverpool]CBZ54638.1 conserved hypothetical protein [Neospora caninum Liverpool]CEL69354.1 TPA: hypothetical protein BN1204_050660 [Neospora caninum Liverpool]|eukprot:XP_003884668.1 conserved hypothetical protein [Neospora caninum Liverpool]
MKRLPELRLPARTASQLPSGQPQQFLSVSSRRVLCFWMFVGALSSSLAVTMGFRIGSPGTTSPAIACSMYTRSRCGCTSPGLLADTTAAQRTPSFPESRISEFLPHALRFSGAVTACQDGWWHVASTHRPCSRREVQQHERQVIPDLDSRIQRVPKTPHEDVNGIKARSCHRNAQRCGPTDKQLRHLAKRLALSCFPSAAVSSPSTEASTVKFFGESGISRAIAWHRLRSLFRSWYFLLDGPPNAHLLGRRMSEGTTEAGTEDHAGSDKLNEKPRAQTVSVEYPPIIDLPDRTAFLLPLDALRSDSPRLVFRSESVHSGKTHDTLESHHMKADAPSFEGRFYRLGRFSALAQLNERHPVPG